MRDRISNLYAVIDSAYVPPDRAGAVARELISAGVRVLQMRAKDLAPGELLRASDAVMAEASRAGVVFIVNDRVDVALACNADGVHLGQDDLPPLEARRILGPSRIIGLSTHNVIEAGEAASFGADYISFGPVFLTKTKRDAQDPKGCLALREARAATALPIVAIGGMDGENMAEAFASGADSVAMISHLLSGPDIRSRAASIVERIASLKA